jgi:AraC-like DNA-binding protein
MIYQRQIPKSPLDNYVDSIIYLEGNNKGSGLPKRAMSLVFNLEDNFKLFLDQNFKQYVDYKKHWIAGLQTQPTNVESYGISKMLVVQFKAVGAFAFFKEPLHYFTNKYVPLDHVFDKEADETWEQLHEAKTLSEKFLLIENFLYRKLLTNKSLNQKFISTVEIVCNGKGNLSINGICSQLNISRKHLNNLSKEYVGVSPKTLSALTRLQNTLKTLSTVPTEKLTHVAYEFEYFDQSHFIYDFKRFTGLTPNEYANLVRKTQSIKLTPHFIPFR